MLEKYPAPTCVAKRGNNIKTNQRYRQSDRHAAVEPEEQANVGETKKKKRQEKDELDRRMGEEELKREIYVYIPEIRFVYPVAGSVGGFKDRETWERGCQ